MNIIEREFKLTSIENVSRDAYQKFINKLGKKLALETVRRHHRHLKACLDHALYCGHIASDPTYKVNLTGKPGKAADKKFLNQEEAKSLIQTLKQGYTGAETSRAMCLFALSTGCRLGEVMALTEDDIDRETMTLTINKSWDYKSTYTFTETKTASSVRKIAIDQDTLSLIDQHINYYKRYALKTGKRNRKKLVFVGRDLQPVSSTGVNKALKKACVRAGVQEITFHSLRHTHASLLLMNEVDIFFISKRLGHSSTLVTAEVYAHVLKEMEDKGNKEVSELAKIMYQ